MRLPQISAKTCSVLDDQSSIIRTMISIGDLVYSDAALASGQEMKARLLQDLEQGDPVEAKGSPVAAPDDPEVQLRGNAVDVRIGRGHDGLGRCRGQLIRQDHDRGPDGESGNQQVPGGRHEPASSHFSTSIARHDDQSSGVRMQARALVARICLSRGLIIRSLPGGDVSAFSPPLTLSREEVDQTVER